MSKKMEKPNAAGARRQVWRNLGYHFRFTTNTPLPLGAPELAADHAGRKAVRHIAMAKSSELARLAQMSSTNFTKIPVTVLGSSQMVSKEPAAVLVITVEDFKSSGAHQFPKVLRFVPSAARGCKGDVLKAVGGMPALPAGGSAGFCKTGGRINFVNEDRRVHFAINNKAVEAVKSKINSQLPKLARRPKRL